MNRGRICCQTKLFWFKMGCSSGFQWRGKKCLSIFKRGNFTLALPVIRARWALDSPRSCAFSNGSGFHMSGETNATGQNVRWRQEGVSCTIPGQPLVLRRAYIWKWHLETFYLCRDQTINSWLLKKRRVEARRQKPLWGRRAPPAGGFPGSVKWPWPHAWRVLNAGNALHVFKAQRSRRLHFHVKIK